MTFDPNGGYFGEDKTDTQPKDATVEYGNTAAAPTAAREHYTFTGWYTAAEGGDRFDFTAAIKQEDRAIKLYARWTQNQSTLIFEPNYTNFTGTKATQTEAEGTTTELNPNEYQREGYDFKGWNTQADGLGTDYDDEANYSFATATSTLYAQWERVTYTVTFDPNGGYFGEDTTATQPKDATVEYGNTATAPTVAREHYTFTSWYTAAEGGDKFDFTTAITQEARTIKLYARWTPKTYTVTFDANGGEETMDKQTFTYGISQKLKANLFIYSGHTFTGWNTMPDGKGAPYSGEQEISLTNDLRLYAQWKPSDEPTDEPTDKPTTDPTVTPTTEPTEDPTATPTTEPTEEPTVTPTVRPMPLVIIQQPKNQSTMAGQKAVFSVQASGENLTYQWYVNRNDGLGFVVLEGATAAAHTTTALTQANDNYQYYCLVSNGETSIQSDVITLSVAANVDVPKTGDSTKLTLWLTMAAASVIGMIVILGQTRRRKG